jgi:hypothetical protein
VSVAARWRIVEMEVWDRATIDLLGPAFIEIRNDDQGSFRFIAVEGWMDIRSVDRVDGAGIEFSWEGSDELDPASGRGWATLTPDGSLEGRIFLHMGDDSWFRGGAGDCPSTSLTHLARFWTSLEACLMS